MTSYINTPEFEAMDAAIRAYVAKDGQIATGWIMAASSIPLKPEDEDVEEHRLTYQMSEGCSFHQAVGILVDAKDQLMHPTEDD